MSAVDAKDRKEWEALKKSVPLAELGGQAIFSIKGDRQATAELQFQSDEDIFRVNDLKHEINNKLPEDADIQDYLDVLTKHTPVICKDVSDSRVWRCVREVKSLFGLTHPKYRWLFAYNMASVALCHHARDQLIAENQSIDDLTVTIIPLDTRSLSGQTIMETNTNFRNMFLGKGS